MLELDKKAKDKTEFDKMNKNDVESLFTKIFSWKLKRAVFRDCFNLIEPEDDWSVFNIVQNVKQKIYNLPRKIFETKEKSKKDDEKPKEKEQAPSNINPKKEDSKLQETTPQHLAKVIEEDISKEESPKEEALKKLEEDNKEKTLLQESPKIQEMAIDELPAVIPNQSSQTCPTSNLAKRKPEISSDRE